MWRAAISCVAWAMLLAASASAQDNTVVRHLGWLAVGGTEASVTQTAPAIVQELAKLRWIDGRNLSVRRFIGGSQADSIARSASEIVNLEPDIILTTTSPGLRALKQRTSTIPIVFVTV